MPLIRVKENEPFEVAMRRFKRAIEKTGLLTDLRAREFYEKPTTERKRKHAAACKRQHKRLRSQMLPKKMYWFLICWPDLASGASKPNINRPARFERVLCLFAL